MQIHSGNIVYGIMHKRKHTWQLNGVYMNNTCLKLYITLLLQRSVLRYFIACQQRIYVACFPE